MILNFKTALCLTFAMGILAACKKEKDQTAATFEFISISPNVGSDSICGELSDKVISILSGENLTFQFKIDDNKNLGQYKIDIHDDFDCHGHEGERSPIPTIWSVQDVVNTSGTTQTVSRTLQVPNDVMAGNYHFQIKIIDAEGNETQNTPIHTLKIRNSSDTLEPYFLQFTAPNNNITRGQTLVFSGTVIDNLSLENGRIELAYHNPNDEHNTAQTYVFPVGSTIEENFNFSFLIPNSFITGTYEFEVTLYDNVGNSITRKFEIIVQ
jgi:Domain of unknown function (DUF4625)/Bacterial Ig-like domain